MKTILKRLLILLLCIVPTYGDIVKPKKCTCKVSIKCICKKYKPNPLDFPGSGIETIGTYKVGSNPGGVGGLPLMSWQPMVGVFPVVTETVSSPISPSR